MENYSKLQKQTGSSYEIFRAIGSEEEAQIYIKAGLKEKIVNNRCSLINPSIDRRAYNFK